MWGLHPLPVLCYDRCCRGYGIHLRIPKKVFQSQLTRQIFNEMKIVRKLLAGGRQEEFVKREGKRRVSD